MGTRNVPHRKFSVDFKLRVLSEYYQSDESRSFTEQKYNLAKGSLYYWEKEFVLNEKELSLSSELLEKISLMRKERLARHQREGISQSKEEELSAEIARLRKALEYSELRNEALNEVLRIGREEYGIDLLKKAGAKQ